MSRLIFSAALVAALLAFGTVRAATPVIIDTDMAADDWLAILFLMQHEDLDVLAVTVNGTGEATCDPGVRNTMNLLELTGDAGVPVACGTEKPLSGKATFPQAWRDAVNRMHGLEVPENPGKPSDLDAVALLQQALGEAPEKVVLITLGALTNVAELLRDDPGAAQRIEHIYVMGGALDVPGNLCCMDGVNGAAEWNIFVDPVAAAETIASGIPLTLVALDATNRVPLANDFFRMLEADHTTPEAAFAFSILETQRGFLETGDWYFWDPLAAAIATEASLATIEQYRVSVVTKKGKELGRTKPDKKGTQIGVTVDADAARFYGLFLDVLNGRSPE